MNPPSDLKIFEWPGLKQGTAEEATKLFNDLKIVHGTKSSTLVMIRDDPRLIPSGQLLLKMKAPMWGELYAGIIDTSAPNYKSISFYRFENLSGSISYAKTVIGDRYHEINSNNIRNHICEILVSILKRDGKDLSQLDLILILLEFIRLKQWDEKELDRPCNNSNINLRKIIKDVIDNIPNEPKQEDNTINDIIKILTKTGNPNDKNDIIMLLENKKKTLKYVGRYGLFADLSIYDKYFNELEYKKMIHHITMFGQYKEGTDFPVIGKDIHEYSYYPALTKLITIYGTPDFDDFIRDHGQKYLDMLIAKRRYYETSINNIKYLLDNPSPIIFTESEKNFINNQFGIVLASSNVLGISPTRGSEILIKEEHASLDPQHINVIIVEEKNLIRLREILSKFPSKFTIKILTSDLLFARED